MRIALIKAVAFATALAMTPILGTTGAFATDGSISVDVNMARILRIGSPAATVIIGNPGVADVTIQDPQTLVLTGKSYGNTNLIILDNQGEPIADTFVEVVQRSSDVVTVFQGASRTSMSCNPVCQPTIMIGDDTGFTSQTLASSTMIEDAAD